MTSSLRFKQFVMPERTYLKVIMFSIHPNLLDRDTYANAKLQKNLQILAIAASKLLGCIASVCKCLATDIKTMLIIRC